MFPPIVSAFLGSGVGYLLLRKIFVPWLIQGRNVSPRDQIYLASKLLSTIHASAVALDAFRHVVINKTWHKDTVNPYPASLDYYFGGHLGYTLFEICLFVIRGEPFSLWLHHLIDACGSFGMMCYR